MNQFISKYNDISFFANGTFMNIEFDKIQNKLICAICTLKSVIVLSVFLLFCKNIKLLYLTSHSLKLQCA